MKFRSAIQWTLYVPILILLTGAGVLIACSGVWLILILNLLVAALLLHTVTHTWYEIGDGILHIRSGLLFRQNIPLSSVRRIKVSTSVLSAPAASLRGRLEIRYGKYTDVIVSPEDTLGFVNAMRVENPEIEWDEKGVKR